MGAKKSEEFTLKDNRIANYAKPLTQPPLNALICFLIKKQISIFGKIVD
jgi:hypothetical protein